MLRLYRPLVRARTWRETLHLLLDLPLGIAWFTIAVTLLSVGGGMVITLVGLPLLAGAVWAGRAIAAADRARARVLLDLDLPGFARPPQGGTLWARCKAAFTDRGGWYGLLYGVVMLPWGIVAFTVAVVVWSIALGFATYPLYGWWLSNRIGDHYVLTGWGKTGSILGIGVVGLLLLAAAPWIVRALAAVDRGLCRGLLSPNAEQQLARRVQQLTVSRDASVEGAQLELRRIERDLHDGAQQRLVGLAMDLGLAREQLAAGGDPQDAAELVNRAHDEAKHAIAELRNLVRGIMPSVLTDLGLDAALSALAARCPVPVDVEVHLAERPPAAVESVAYFVVAEALTNVAKHSQATQASVRVSRRDNIVHVEVLDNGVGGAGEHAGSGLNGLRDRVLGIEGTLRVASPAGGPTLLVAELPCAS